MRRQVARIVTGALLVGALAVGILVADKHHEKHAAAMFSQVVQLYPGDGVRVLGVPVGKVTAINPTANGVRVDFTYDADAPVPASADAAIVAPSLISGRFIQLSPAKVGGPRLRDGAVIGRDRTAVPFEYDELKRQLDDLTTMLGPNEVNKNGALNGAIAAMSSTLNGNGESLNKTVGRLAAATGTLAAGGEDLFGTVRNLEVLASALKDADSQIAPFASRLHSFSNVLADSSADLGRMLGAVDASVQHIGDFVREHSGRLGENVSELARLSAAISENRQALADLLQKLPTAASNMANIYEPFTGGITGGLSVTQFGDLAGAACSALLAQGPAYQQCISSFGPALHQLNLAYPPLAFNDLQRNGSANCIQARDGAPPDTDPVLHSGVGPAVKPNQGFGERPFGARCGPAASPAEKLSQLLVPVGGG